MLFSQNTFWPDGAVFKELQLKQNLFDSRQIWRAARLTYHQINRVPCMRGGTVKAGTQEQRGMKFIQEFAPGL